MIGEELGVARDLRSPLPLRAVAYAGLRVGEAAKGAYAALLAVGVTALIMSQAALNTFAVLGLAPLTGVPLPFVSYGSTSLIVMLASIGLLLNVAGGGAAHLRALGTQEREPARSADAARRSRSRRAGPQDTSCRRWRWRTSCARGELASSSSAGTAPSVTSSRRRGTSFIRSVSRGSPGATRSAPRAGSAESAGASVRARRLLREGGAQAVMGGGGYVAAPVALAGATLGLPVILTEADSHLGLANRALAPLSRRVCLAFALDGRDGERYLVTGRPGPAASSDRQAARAALEIEEDMPCVLVFGGSLGARSINEAAFEAFAHAPFAVLHVTGSRDYESFATRPRASHYAMREYLPVAAFSEALAASDLVVARAGGSVFEIAAHGRPAILIPYPHAAADHQRTNALWMERAGAAVVIADAELTGATLRAEVDRLLGDPALLAGMAEASAGLARPDAAAAVADELLAAINEVSPPS